MRKDKSLEWPFLAVYIAVGLFFVFAAVIYPILWPEKYCQNPRHYKENVEWCERVFSDRR